MKKPESKPPAPPAGATPEPNVDRTGAAPGAAAGSRRTTSKPRGADEPPAGSAPPAKEIDLDEPEKEPAAPAAPTPPDPGFVPGDVLDFCALRPREDTSRFVKRRTIVFALGNTAPINSDPQLAKVGGAQLARDVFAARFPLGRFYNVITEIPPDPAWATASELSVEDVRRHVLPRSEAQTEQDENDGSDDEGRAAEQRRKKAARREREFVAYSAACADFLAIPRLTAFSVEWIEVEIKTKSATRKLRSPEISLEGSLVIFKRTADTYKRVDEVSASVPGLLDAATDIAASSIPDVDLSLGGLVDTAAKAIQMPPHISALPDAACAIGAAAADGDAGLGGCSRKGHAKAALVPDEIEERAGPTCKKVTADDVEPGEQQEALIQCEVRSRAAQLVRQLQKDARSVEGWYLHAPRQTGVEDDPEAPAISLGEEEALKVGYGFVALDAKGERLAFYKATDIGPGGEVGLQKPSELSLRLGDDVPEGTSLKEYPQIGISLMPYFGPAFLTWNYGRTTKEMAEGGVTYDLASTMIGGGVNVSYDLSGLIGLAELYLRIGGGAYAGVGGADTTLIAVPIDVAFEKGFYLGRVAAWYLGLGFTTTQIIVSTAETDGGGIAQDMSVAVYGALVRTGFDFLVHPDVSLRLECVARLNFNQAQYKTSEDEPLENNWGDREDHYMSFAPTGALQWTF
ncbi:MAG: hypothetical protein HY744_09070 [Deltaproteobacteria bacterium]|nr:hypothetical protein [Deltaproteobacteria bacterium]